MRFIYLISFVLLLSNGLSAQAPLKVRLWNEQGKRVPLQKATLNEPCVVIFLSATCPICQKYAGLLPELNQKYPQINFVGVFTKWEKWEDIQQFKKDYNFNIPLLVDKKNQLLRQLDATTTPEVFLLDKKGAIQYQGAIDNWFYSLGKNRPAITEHYLTDALDAFLQGNPIAIQQTKPVGCIIEQ